MYDQVCGEWNSRGDLPPKKVSQLSKEKQTLEKARPVLETCEKLLKTHQAPLEDRPAMTKRLNELVDVFSTAKKHPDKAIDALWAIVTDLFVHAERSCDPDPEHRRTRAVLGLRLERLARELGIDDGLETAATYLDYAAHTMHSNEASHVRRDLFIAYANALFHAFDGLHHSLTRQQVTHLRTITYKLASFADGVGEEAHNHEVVRPSSACMSHRARLITLPCAARNCAQFF